MTLRITHQISKSAGWGRYKVVGSNGAPIVRSSTGNEWLYSDKDVDVADGEAVVVTLQTQERRTKWMENYRLVAGEGSAKLGFWNGLEVTVDGAVLA